MLSLLGRSGRALRNTKAVAGFNYQANGSYSKNAEDSEEAKSKSSSYNTRYFTTGGALLLAGYLYSKDRSVVSAAEPLLSRVGEVRPNLPVYTRADVSKHADLTTQGVWVTYKNGVYDITKFIPTHPGGEKILMAAGGSLEPFWSLYAVHKQPEILGMLEEFRIGNLNEEDLLDDTDSNDPYSGEPRRHPALRPSSVKPFNAEPPPEILVDSYLTPNDLFYVRNHLPVPEVDPKTYRLEITGMGIKSKSFSLNDLKKLPKTTITATIQCAGNRRSEMSKIKHVKGLNWGHAAIGNAAWTGVKLSDLLRSLGLKDLKGDWHVQLEGLDTDPASTPYGASIPMSKAFDPEGDVLLAYEMNGEPLSKDHGFPLRAIIPGVVGARNVKWLGKIIVSNKESDSHWQTNDYKGFCPSVDWDTVDFSSAPAIQELPVISAICTPKEGESVRLVDDKLEVKGYAWSGGGRKIVRVDVTLDGGKTWQVANLDHQDPASHPKNWAWTLWSAYIPIKPGTRKADIWVKATDSSYNTQPENVENIWNLRGVLNNSYHKIRVNIMK